MSDPIKIQVELVQSADVKRLDEADAALAAKIDALEQRVIAQHRTIYELMERLARLRSL